MKLMDKFGPPTQDVGTDSITGASGAIPRCNYKRKEEHAIMYYEAVRSRRGDAERIAENTGFSVEVMQKIKAHMFFNKYDLGDKEPRCFDADYDQAVSWQNLIQGGTHIREMDLILLRHEFLEYELMHTKQMSYNEAHMLADRKYCYSNFVKKLDAKEGVV
jgi:hypothetical protein